jgi:hypothetical protein
VLMENRRTKRPAANGGRRIGLTVAEMTKVTLWPIPKNQNGAHFQLREREKTHVAQTKSLTIKRKLF